MGIFSKIIRKLESINVPLFAGIFSSLIFCIVGLLLSISGEGSNLTRFSFFALAVLALIFTKGKFFGAHSARLVSFLVFAAPFYLLWSLFFEHKGKWFGDCCVTSNSYLEIEIFISIVLAYLSYFAVKRFISKFVLICCEEKLKSNQKVQIKALDNVLAYDSCCEYSNKKLVNSVIKSKLFFNRAKSDELAPNIENSMKCIWGSFFKGDGSLEEKALMAFDRKLCFFFALIAYFNKFKLERKFGLGLFFICALGHLFFSFLGNSFCRVMPSKIFSWHIISFLLFYISILLALFSLKVKYFGAKFVRFLTFFTFCILNLVYGYFYNLNLKRALLVLGVTGLVYLFLRYIVIRLLIITKNGIYGV